MEKIEIRVRRSEVYEEVAKITDYTGTKLLDSDANARDRLLMTDEDLSELGRLWDESQIALNENFKEMLISGETREIGRGDEMDAVYEARLEVSKGFDVALTASVESAARSYFIAAIASGWFRLANSESAELYSAQAAQTLLLIDGFLYSRKRPKRHARSK